MEYDVIIVGAGISGLSCAIELHKISRNNKQDISICVLEKSAKIGGNILSGCLMNPRAMNQLLPDWQNILNFHPQKVEQEEMVFLTKHSYKILSKHLNNNGNYIISLSQLVSSLGDYATSLGIDIFTSTAVADFIVNKNNSIIAIKTGDLGVNTQEYQEGYEIQCKQLVLAEGCRGSLTKKIIDYFKLDRFSSPQTYALGIKEVWSVSDTISGFASHSVGYPLDKLTYGGGFLYSLDKNTLAVGFVNGLDYQDTYLDPYQKFQEFKKHPYISRFLHNGRCIEYGAKTISEGGVQSLPKLTFPGGLLVGESAGFVNTVSLKGSHLAIESGMIAAKSIIEWLSKQSIEKNDQNISANLISKIYNNKYEATSYKKTIKKHQLYKELYKIRNIRPAFTKGLIFGSIYYLIETYLFRYKSFWTLRNNIPDYKKLRAINSLYNKERNQGANVINQKMQSIALSNISHNHEQPCHLIINNENLIYESNQKLYDNPETRYCPAGVYKLLNNKLIIQSQNCLHCKACDIKDPMQNIIWTPPEGGSGPNYTKM
jgi:electron-transferring-flavoprotein dehydrogenase